MEAPNEAKASQRVPLSDHEAPNSASGNREIFDRRLLAEACSTIEHRLYTQGQSHSSFKFLHRGTAHWSFHVSERLTERCLGLSGFSRFISCAYRAS